MAAPPVLLVRVAAAVATRGSQEAAVAAAEIGGVAVPVDPNPVAAEREEYREMRAESSQDPEAAVGPSQARSRIRYRPSPALLGGQR